MKLLLVIWVDPWTRSVATVHKWVEAGRALGHDVRVFGKPQPELPGLAFTTDLDGIDLALFAIQLPGDFPDMPYLARLLDGIPRARRAVVDLWGRYNDTIRVEHDFNHLEKFDGHLGWEWDEAIRAVSDTILQPTLAPLRSGVGSFLFHGFDPGSVVKPYKTSGEAVASWKSKLHGVTYVGSNWQRWDQVRTFLQGYGAVNKQAGRASLIGWNWGARPDSAVQQGIMGIDTDAKLLGELNVEVREGVRFDEIVGLLGNARFAPVFHRPLFQHLAFVTNRTFETFYADTIPVLMLPRDFIVAIYGEAALKLAPGDDIAGHLSDALNNPEDYWDAVLKTRDYLAQHHSYERRFQQLGTLANVRSPSGAAR